MSLPRTLGELRQSPFSEEQLSTRRVKDEMRDNLIVKLRQGGAIFPGIVGYDDTVVPQIVNAILSRHNFILLGLRGQAKSRILRALTTLLDPQVPYVAGCEIHDNPYAPICRRCREKIAKLGDATPIAYLTPERTLRGKTGHARRHHRRPDRRHRSHQGSARRTRTQQRSTPCTTDLLPRANHGIFAINELPDLAGKIQVGLFNIMQEGDVQIKGYPIRLPLDVALVFSANPEDYTARGKIITPLKDRIGSEIRTHYPATVEEGIAITAQESWTQRNGHKLHLPKYVQEVIERIAFAAREDKKIDKRSGVSQRLPISAMENVISNAERRAIHQRRELVVPRIADVYAAMPAITGKLELEYEGEMKGADHVSRELIRAAVAKTHDEYFNGVDMQQIVQWFDLGGEIQLADTACAAEALPVVARHSGLDGEDGQARRRPKESPESQVSAAEFILEGLHAHKRIGRNEERVFTAGEKQPKPAEKPFEREETPFRGRRPYN